MIGYGLHMLFKHELNINCNSYPTGIEGEYAAKDMVDGAILVGRIPSLKMN